MMQINVTGGTIDRRELDAYVARANNKYPIGTVQALDIHVDGEFVDLQYHLALQPHPPDHRLSGGRYEPLERCEGRGGAGPGQAHLTYRGQRGEI